jgi:3'-5' exoribonuclease
MDAIEYLLKTSYSLDTKLHRICSEIIEDERFQESPGGSTHHHAFRGGLAIHTAEVVWAARNMAARTDIINFQVLLTAAICHDRNKIYEYEIIDGSVKNKPYRDLIGHVAGSWQWFTRHAATLGVDEDLVDQISHCMLSHHGRLEWRSPVEPKTPEAFILHSADMLSAKGWSGLPKFEMD